MAGGARYGVYPERILGVLKVSVRLSVGPLASCYSYIFPYNFVENSLLMLVDPAGLGPESPIDCLVVVYDDTDEYCWDPEKDAYDQLKTNSEGSVALLT